MKAWQIKSYGSVEVFELNDIPVPQNRQGWVLIKIKAFGLNRSELYTRQGHSGSAVTLPRVLGIECVGEVIDGGGTDLEAGQKVAAAMGQMGRKHDGGYAEMTSIPRSNVFPVTTDLPWDVFGALPETYLTAWGAIKEAIELPPNSSLLIRGGTSAAGLASACIAKDMGCKIISTTRSDRKRNVLEKVGIDHIIIDDGHGIQDQVKTVISQGVAGAIEFVGLEKTIKDCLLCVAPKGTLCLVGFLGNSWEYDFFPWMRSTVKLTLYSSETIHSDRQTSALQSIVSKVEEGIYSPNIHQVFAFEELPRAQKMMEKNLAAGKLVVTI